MYAFHHERGVCHELETEKMRYRRSRDKRSWRRLVCNRKGIVPTFHLPVLKGSCHAVAKSIEILGHNRLYPARITLCYRPFAETAQGTRFACHRLHFRPLLYGNPIRRTKGEEKRRSRRIRRMLDHSHCIILYLTHW